MGRQGFSVLPKSCFLGAMFLLVDGRGGRGKESKEGEGEADNLA